MLGHQVVVKLNHNLKTKNMLNKIVLIITIILVILIGFFGYIYLTQENPNDGVEGVVSTVRNFFPFGQESTVSETTNQTTNETPAETTSEPKTPPKFRQIFSSPVAGAEAFTVGSSTVIRFVEKSTGNIFEAKTEIDTINRISNTTIPKITEVSFVQSGSVLMRYLRDDTDMIETILGNLSTSTNATSTTSSLNEVESTYLTPNIKDVAMSPKKDKIFYTTQSESGMIGTISNPDGTKGVSVFNSPIREWNTSWPKIDTITLTTKADSEALGYMYTINTVTGKSERVLGDILGLTTLTNPTASTTIYNQNDQDGNTYLNTYDIKTKTSSPIKPTTLTEKCVWSKKDAGILYCAVPNSITKGSYPEKWYQGLVSFSDSIWKIDTKTGKTDMLINIKEVSGKDLDIVNPALDEKEKLFIFSNKTDLSLWSFEL